MTLDVGQLFAIHGPAIRGYLLRRTGDRELADDLAQQVWIRVWRSADRFEDRGRPISAYLYRIASNILIDHVRREHGTVSLEVVEQQRATVDAGSARHADRIDVTAALAEVLDGAPERQAAVIRCRFVEGLNVAQTAASLGITGDGVKKLQSRALARLRCQLELRAS